MGFIEQLKNSYKTDVYTFSPMSKITGYGVGGLADYLIQPRSLKGFVDSIELAQEYNVPYKILGNGTNVLVSDKGYKGAIIHTKYLSSVKYKNGEIHALTGAMLGQVICFGFGFDLYGAEKLVGIPASVGGSVTMNASAYGSSVSDFINYVIAIKDGSLHFLDKKDCGFAYRKSIFQTGEYAIAKVVFNFDKKQGYDPNFQKRIDDCKEKRRISQPVGRSCGSVFKNPKDDFAGRLIEAVGLKGYSIGGAKISDKHANFIVTDAHATANDVYALMEHVRKTVRSQFGVLLDREVELLGEF